MMDQMSNHHQLRRMVEQLQREADIQRIKTSEASSSLMDYVRRHQKDDFLVPPCQQRNPKANPFREKSICTLL
ncbi:guanine nucleotide-binding protein subunit gamma-1-like isoform X4 [Oratosquilla oratoria]|uniref:guanine nucleotide-binding protein subunit gamma-1-like isoform X4 n=1 Tax=Oratosquilla oratoria TaxID=337810 RepID=UPI003F760866